MNVIDPTLDPALVAFGIIVLGAYLVQTAIGFGSMLICVTFGAQFLPLEEVIRLAIPLSFLQTGYIVIRHWEGVRWPLLLRRVLPFMALGMAAAFAVLAAVRGPGLGLAFGLMVLVLSARDIRKLRHADDAAAEPPISLGASIAALFSAGFVHGIYASGGPMLVYAIGREGLGKRDFRSTLCMIWILLNVILVARFVSVGAYQPGDLYRVLFLLPAVPIGIVLGEWVHHRVDERRFRMAVLVLLLAAAISLILRYGAQLL
ncbi:MAG: sulfite exporter TauE/SafE family protein [Myxococcota bacterium]